MKKELPKVSIITVNYNGKKFLNGCFRSLLNLNYPKKKIEIFMVDNGSKDDSLNYVRKKFPSVKIIINKENNYAIANNLGIKASRGEFIALINNDVRVDKNWLITLVRMAQSDASIGAVGSKILFMDGSVQSFGHQEYPNFYWGDIGFKDMDAKKYNMKKEVASICGCSVLYRRKCLSDVGLLDEDFNIFIEDVDMGIRCRKKGWKLVSCPESIIYHKFHSTFKNENDVRYLVEKNRLLLIAKHWPEKLAEALSGKGYFTIHNDYTYNSVRDISEVLGNVFIKLIKEHGLEIANKLSPDLFTAIRRIYNFEKDHLIQEAKLNNIAFSIKEQELQAKNQEIALRDQQIIAISKELESLGQKYHEDQALLRQQKDQELSSLIQQFALMRKQKDQELSLRQDLEILIQQKEQEISAKNQELSLKDQQIQTLIQDIESLKKKYDEELISLRKQKEEELQIKNQELFLRDQQIASLRQDLELTKQQKKQEIALKNNEIKERERNIHELHREIADKDILMKFLEQDKECLRLDLQHIYTSTGYRYILKPLWAFLWPIKQFFRKIKNPLKILKKLRKPFIDRRANIAYFNHISKNTFPPKPKRMSLLITRKCNLNCLFCDIPKQKYTKEEMPKEEALKIIEAAVKLGIKYIDISGGEPLLHPYLFEIIDYAKSKNLEVSIVTNGILVKPNLEKIIRSKIDTISVSIDGTFRIHNKLRNNPNAFGLAMEGLNALISSGLDANLSVNFVVTKENVSDLEEIYNYFYKRNIPVGFWPVNNQPHLYLQKESEKKIFLDFVNKLRSERKISEELYRYYIEGLRYFSGRKMNVRCLGLVESFGVDVEGDILPCCVWDNKKYFTLGNAIKDDLETLWHSKEFYETRKRIFCHGCNNCYNVCLSDFNKITGKSFCVNGQDNNLTQLRGASPAAIKKIGPLTKKTPSEIIKPNSVLWSSTVRCNLSCLHCDNWKAKPNKELTTEEAKGFITELKEWLGDFEFIIGGGEPFVRKDIIQIIEFCSKQKIRTTISTNGTLLNENLCDALLNSGLTNLNFSVDGMSDSTHDYTRNYQGALEKALTAILYCNDKRRDMNLTISSIIMQSNINEIFKLVDFTKKNKLSGIYFLPLMSNFNSPLDSKWYKKSYLWPQDINKLKDLIDRLIEFKAREPNTHTGNYLILNSFHHLNLFKKYYSYPEAEFSEPCTVGRRMFSISEDGHILLCPLEKPVGSIFEKKITEYFYSPEADLCRENIDNCKKSCKILGCYNAE